ncbi:hypothetical protein [Bradyrhizobium sp. Pha-3]|uniref:hypothetical protein n=1 Tax=Bradyrhizobium TaxID=374 RepID=UPI0035D3E883
MLAIDDDDVEPLTRQPLCDQRTGDAGADDQRIAGEIFSERRRTLRRRTPGWRAATQIGLFGLV